MAFSAKNHLGLVSGEKPDFPRELEDLISVASRGAVDDLEVVVHEERPILSRGAKVQKTKLNKKMRDSANDTK